MIWARLAFFLLVVYALLVVIVFLTQRSLQYHPSKDMGDPRVRELLGMREVTYDTDDGLKLTSWYAPPKDKDGKVIVYFHGNAGNISGRAVRARMFIDHGYGVLMAEYRGYGGNPGTPTEEGLYKDGRAALKFLDAEGIRVGQMVFYGESLGTGVSVQLAGEVQPPQVILESPFTSAVEVGERVYFYLPVNLLMRDRYDSLSKIKQVKSSLLMLHGARDGLIPLALGRKLFNAANDPKQFIEISNGGHANLLGDLADQVFAWIEPEQPFQPENTANPH